MSQKSYGLGYERKEKHYLECRGFEAFRCRGSFGGYDIIAIHPEQGVLLTSVKSTRRKKGSYKPEIKRLIKARAYPDTLRRLVVYYRGDRHVVWEERVEAV